jgi:hypothetical protein
MDSFVTNCIFIHVLITHSNKLTFQVLVTMDMRLTGTDNLVVCDWQLNNYTFVIWYTNGDALYQDSFIFVQVSEEFGQLRCLVVVNNMFVNVLYCYISTSRSTCAMPSKAVLCSSWMSCFRGILLRYFLIDFELVPVVPIITDLLLLLLLLPCQTILIICLKYCTVTS